MAKQLEVIKFRDVVTVTALTRFVPNLSPLTIEVIGEDFSSVEEVFVNDVKAPEIIVVNRTTLWVQLPEAAQNGIRSIEVISSAFTSFDQSKLSFKIGPRTKTIEGPLKLMQLFVKWMLQTPGSDIFNPARGGGLQELAGKVTTTRQMDPIIATITRSVNQTSTQIQRSQVAQPKLPLGERLLSADIVNVDVSTQLMEAHLKISLLTMSGEDALASIQL
jgi:hypothetical protein